MKLVRIISGIFVMSCLLCCQTELSDAEIFNDKQMLAEAKNWYDAQVESTVVLKSGFANEKSKIAYPNWRDTQTTNSKNMDVVEVGLYAKGWWGFTLDTLHNEWLKTLNEGYLSSHTRLVLTKSKTDGKRTAFLMTIVADKPYLRKRNFKIWQGNSYLEKEKDFSGLVFYHDLKGRFVNGWRYTSGRVSHTVVMDSVKSTGPRLKSGGCTTYFYYNWNIDYIEWYYYTIVGSNVSSSHYNGMTINNISFVTITVSMCNYDDGGGGGGMYIDGMDNSESSNTLPTVDDYNLMKFPKLWCIYQKLKNGEVLPKIFSRFYGLTLPQYSILGEQNLRWNVGNLSNLDPVNGVVFGITEPINSPSPQNPGGYFINIIIDERHVDESSSYIALILLHEAIHAMLLAEFYDELGTTDFATLFNIKSRNLYGADAQHIIMACNDYVNILANGLQQFDISNGLTNRSLIFYQKAVMYSLRYHSLRDLNFTTGEMEFEQLIHDSLGDCK